MPPVIAVVAAVASVGAIAAPLLGGAILGISSAVFGAIALGASVVGSLLKSKPKVANSKENIDRLRASIDPRTPRKTVFGKTAMATDIRDEEFTDSQTYFHRFIVCAAHKVNAITEIWFDDKVAWTLAGGVQGEFVGYLTVTPILEGNSGNAINISARMGTTRRYTGCAYIHLRYKLTGNTNNADSPFAQSITTRITIRGEGAFIYDPRLDTTVAGGSGAHRADNQTTWVWDADACRNPALALLFYLLGWRIAGELSVGKGIPMDRIDLASFAVAANICDESVATEAAGTEPRYRCDGVWSEGDAPTTVIEMLKATMNADLDDVDGKLRLTIFHNDLATPDADFTDADVLGAFEWNAQTPLDQSFNIVRGIYTDPSDASLYQPVNYPDVLETSPDGIDRIYGFDLPMVESPGQAQRLANLRLQRQKYGGTFKAEFQATAWRVEKNSVCRLTFAPLGFVNKLFRVAEMDLRQDGVVPLVLREENSAIYGAPTLEAAVAVIDATPYDPTLNPLYQDIIGISGQITTITGTIGQNGTISGTINSTTTASVSTSVAVTVGAGGLIELYAAYSFSATAGSGSYHVYAQWFEETSPGTWTALGTETQSDFPASPGISEEGSGEVIYSISGRTPAASHTFRVQARNVSGTVDRVMAGSCYALPG